MKTLPFNLEKALNGEPTVTRKGWKPEKMLLVPEIDAINNLLVVLHGMPFWYFHNGKLDGPNEERFDLFMLQKTRKIWVNLYYLDGVISCEGQYDKRSTAIQCSNKGLTIKTVEIEIPE